MFDGFFDITRQFPVVAIVLGVVWWSARHITRQHARELADKDAEIQRLIADKNELRRERDRYGRLALRVRRRGPGGPAGPVTP